MFKRIALMGAAAMLAAAPAVHAQDKYPSRPITLVSPYQAGGTTETFARLIIDDVAAILGQPIVVEQKPGAAGTIGARFVATSKGDGYTCWPTRRSTSCTKACSRTCRSGPWRASARSACWGRRPSSW